MRSLLVNLAVGVALLACSGGGGSSDPAPGDAGVDTRVEPLDGAVEAKPVKKDGGNDACTPCPISIKIQLDGVTRPMDRVQYGYDDAGKTILYLESYAGGSPECPGPKAATPDRTLILSGVRVGQKTTEKDGAHLTLLDFKGDLTTEPAVKATAVTFTPASCCLLPGQVAFTLDATIPKGTVTGTFVADHCDSLDTI